MSHILNNITFTQFIKHYFLYVNDRIRSVNKYRKTYKNYLQIIKPSCTYPIIAYLKNGTQVTLNNKMEAYALTTGFNNYIRNENGITTIFNEKLVLKLS